MKKVMIAVLVAAAVASEAAWADEGAASPPAGAEAAARELAGEWRLASWASPDRVEKLVPVEFPSTIVFENGKVRGCGPVNGYGSLEAFTLGKGNTISFPDFLIQQKSAEDEKLNKAEDRYFQLLRRVKTFKVEQHKAGREKDKLIFMDAKGKPILVFNG